ncbi:uncharacterized protein LOC134195129 isoform X2 [Corticium candelabrum]|uniref:uncharacterized protein LOC134195129 isoform X2 n=1 Tax=Corticium candelabrum TaxID=121492 RepID=UPI002E264193|nr:uncharacterized protein LOC134195129 isoform X2 [Corticium candelabrum]
MDLKRMLTRLRTMRIVFLVLTTVARGILSGELMYIILDGHFTSMCWLHADMNACTLASIASTLLLIVSGSFLLLDVLGALDFVERPLVTKAALFVDGLLVGQLVFIFVGSFSYTLVQWIRTVVDWPYITLDDDKHVCPELDDCSIPVHVHYCAMILLVIFITNLCLLSLQFFRIKKALACIELVNDAG